MSESREYDVLLRGCRSNLGVFDLIVELHGRREIRPREHFAALFGTTHEVKFIDMQRRVPRPYSELARLTSEQREALLYERTDPFGWACISATARGELLANSVAYHTALRGSHFR